MESGPKTSPRYRKPKVDKELKREKDSALNMSFEKIQEHCEKVAGPSRKVSSCIDVNCYFQHAYVECFSILQDKKECIEVLKRDIEQMGGYSFSHVKL